MDILFCNYEYPPLGGGGGVANALLASELAKRHEVTVLTSQGFELPAEEVVDGVRIIRVPVFFRSSKSVGSLLSLQMYIPMGIRAGKRLLAARKVDVINTHFALPSGPVGDALARFAGVPNVLSVHGGDLYDPSKWLSPHRHWFFRTWIRRLLRSADRVVGQSGNTIQNVATYYDPKIDCTRIPLGIRRPDLEPGRRADYGFTDEDVLLVTVGRLVARKATDQLVAMMAGLADLPAHLLIVGAGPQEPMLRECAARHGVTDRVRFMGFVAEAEKFRILNMADLYVSSSQHEGFGIVYLEGMACGLPVICYDYGGQTDFLEDGATGHLLPLNDRDALAERTRRLIRDRVSRERMAKENRRRIEAYFIDNTARQYEDVFGEVIGRRHAGTVGARAA